MLWSLLACSLHTEVSGVVRSESASAPLQLDTLSGESFLLKAGGDAVIFYALSGNSVALAGPRLGRKIWVRHWRVVTGADGSTPYVGRLEKHGANLLLLDRNSGRRFSFDEASLEELQPGIGDTILVRGFAVAPHVLHVVDWQSLQSGSP
jgi:hypothetical protein